MANKIQAVSGCNGGNFRSAIILEDAETLADIAMILGRLRTRKPIARHGLIDFH
ncbi:hypothetical protein T3A99_12525 [Pseudomonas sp. N-137]|uniref:hypothetical protein n=1 Tax=Pseudomonas sp. N-137 TaxID=3108452 RepID=UPI002ADEC7ED|nr:hypothetical protein [Pseudomonas sp. N-137]MEA1029392.1 hypothetical protein [Pseudomonas sp. N-137]